MAERTKITNEQYDTDRPFDGEVFEQDFEDCDFSERDLSGVVFVDCTFTNCNLSMANLTNSRFQDTRFDNSKLVGLNFGTCNDFAFSVHFESCSLDYAAFEGMEIQETVFEGCSLKDASFMGADLRNATLTDCDLTGATFAGTNLESADLRRSRNLSIDPELNHIRKAKISQTALEGLLYKYELDVE